MPEIIIISALFPPEPVVSVLLSKDIEDEIANKYKVVVLCPKPTRPEGFFLKKNLTLSVNRSCVQIHLPLLLLSCLDVLKGVIVSEYTPLNT